MKKYSTLEGAHDLNFQPYRKKTITKVARVLGPFQVNTPNGPLICLDGYVAVDARGYLYPIDREEFNKIYVPL